MVRSTEELAELNRQIGNNIRLFRISEGLTLRELAEKVDLAPQQIQKYEEGKNGVSAARLVLISKALELDITFLLPFSKNYNEFTNTSRNLTMQVARNFPKIIDPEVRSDLAALIWKLSGK